LLKRFALLSFAWTILALTAGTAAPASAQLVVLTESDSGRPLVINGGQSLPTFAPSQLSANEIAAAFVSACTPDPLVPNVDEGGGSFRFTPDNQVFEADNNHPVITIRQWSGDNATLNSFEGSRDALRREPIAIVERGYATTGQYGPFRADLPQCNLVTSVASIEEAKSVAKELEALLGEAKKLVLKDNWADAKWVELGAAENLFISFTAPRVRSGPQPIHLTAFIEE